MNKIAAYFAFAAYVTVAYINPMWTAIFSIAFIISVPFFTEVVNTLLPIDGDYIYQSPAPRMADYYEAFSVEPEVIETTEPTVSDAWGDEPTACELACTITPIVPVQLCLPAGVTVEPVKVIAYASFEYRELQAMVKKLRPNAKAIKLNSKKSVLVDWLVANA